MSTETTGNARRRGHPRVIAVVGTFDVANFGDLLFPELTLHELKARLGEVTLRRFSHRPMSSPPWAYPVEPLDGLPRALEQLDLLIVGGGHLVRFDKAVAPGYEPTSNAQHHPTGYWLGPTLLAANRGIPVVWNALGVSSDTPTWGRALLASAMDAAEYVTVRDAPSLAELHDVHPSASVVQVPDPVFGVSAVLSDAATAAAAVRAELSVNGRYVVVQPTAHLRARADEVSRAVNVVRATGRQVVELPIGPVLGDRAGLLGLDDVVQPEPWPSPLAIVGLIAGADAVVGHSLHLTVVAIAAGVPVFRLNASPGSKYEVLSRFASVQLIPPDRRDWPELVAAATPGSPAPDVLEQRAQLVGHWDRIAELVGARDAKRTQHRRAAVAQLLTRLPALLEERDGAARTVIDEREALQTAVAELERRTTAAEAARARSDNLLTEGAVRADALLAHAEERTERLLGQAAERTERLVVEAVAANERRLADASTRNVELQRRIEELQTALAEAEQRSAAHRRRAEEELALRDAKLVEASAAALNLASTTRDLAKLRSDLDRLRRRRSVRLAVRIANAVRPLLGATSLSRSGLRGRRTDLDDPSAPRGPGEPQTKPASEGDARRLSQRLTESLPPSPRTSGPLVSMVVLNRDGLAHLSRLIPGLERTTYRTFELIIVDNASTDGSVEYLESADRSFDLRIVRNDSNRSFSEGCNQGIALAAGELILLLNNDVEPVTPDWLGRMVTTQQERRAGAVGARLIYPRRPKVDNAGDVRRPDLTLQHRGIGFLPADGIPTPVNLGNGDDPLSADASATRDVVALTAACLLIDRTQLAAVGGLTEGYVYGTEDVDLCLKLHANGASLIYDGGAALWHHEFGTQNAQRRDWKRENRRRNRQLFVDRWGPQLFREVFLDRLRGQGRWSEVPLHVAITLTRDEATAGWGDYYTAKELGEACQRLGWRVSYLERYKDRWYDVDASVDVVISLLDALDIRRLPRRVVTVAWIRNWTDRWIGQPWFEDYDIVFASSATSRRLVEERTAKAAELMPLATNPERFRPRPAAPDLATDLLFAGNFWGEARGVLETLGRLDPGRSTAVYGKRWDQTALGRHHRGELDYERLPEAYASAGIVIDDTAGPTRPYGAVNARVFDALAAGAVVLTDNAEGVRELFDDEFPVATEAATFGQQVDRLLGDPAAASALATRYREIVLRHHTYAHRAEQLQSSLARWATSDRVGILIGARDWERALKWGDYHYARSLQRQLERGGRPVRVEVLPDWEGPAAARADIVVHLFGLSEYRARIAQLNVLWNISHPDLVTPRICNRYDLVFVASETFAAKLATRVRVPVRVLNQATDPERFYPEPNAPAHDVLFVGNSRNVRRKVIDDLLPSPFDVAIYGLNWAAAGVEPKHVKGEYIPNDVLHRYYSAARIVLADHWDDMRREGFLSNRLYDALASGAFVVSDDVVGIQEEFQGAVVTYRDAEDLAEKVRHFLEEEAERRMLAERGRRIVLERHTFAHRTNEILAAVADLLAARPTGVTDFARTEAWIHRRARDGEPPRGVLATSAEDRRE